VPELRQLDGVFLIIFKIGKAVLGRGPAIALTVTDSDNPRLIQKAKRRGVNLLEVRVDSFRRLDNAWVTQKLRSFRKLGMPIIGTIRSRREGGRRLIPDSRRASLFKEILPFIDCVDLELGSQRLRKAVLANARRRRKRVILSYHNFRNTPSDAALAGLLDRARHAGADIVKIAVTPKRKEDVARLLFFTHRNREKNLIAIAMGPRGTASRILAPLFGSLLTYSFAGRSHAPGQLSFEALRKELKPLQASYSRTPYSS